MKYFKQGIFTKGNISPINLSAEAIWDKNHFHKANTHFY